MDQDWILVPSETTDFGFMADWGLQRQVDNLSIAVRLAREVRSLTGSGHGGINVLGYSSGGITAYALANQEAQRPPGQQDVGGLVAVDIHYKYAPGDEDGRAFTCAFAADALGLLDSGTYEDQTGVLFQTLAFLAASAPDDPSPVVPGLSNLQAMLFIASATYEAFPFNEWWHYMGGQFEEGLPTGLEYTTVGQAIDFLSVAAPFEPLRFLFDYTTIMCDESDTPFDDHLADIRVPVLYLGAAGGIGQTGVYTLSLLRRADVTVSIGQLRPDEERALDIGHIDIWTAAVARDVFWRPLLEWIEDHTPGH
jgi:pimeloyl-ACP methyl ester carboxylesterase